MAGLTVGQFETVASGIYLEGLAVDYKRNIVWCSDPVAGGFFSLTSDGTIEWFNQERRWTGGLMLNEDGAVLSTGPGGIMWNNPETGKSGWLLNELEGKPINGINEMMPDGTGGIYFGTNDIEMIERGEDTRPTALYRLTVDREVIKLVDGIKFTNGIMYDSGRRKLYCNSTFEHTHVYDVQPDLTLTNKQIFLDKEDVDGMALDAQGNVWITGFRSNYLTRLRPDGTELPRIETPAGAISQIRFGGADMQDYYITAVPSDGGDSLKEGKELTDKNSHLIKGRSEVPGMPIESARFKLS